MKKFLIFIFLCLSSIIVSHDEYDLLSGQAFQYFISADEKNNCDYDIMRNIFSSVSFGYKKLLSVIRKDINWCKRYVRQCVDGNCVEQENLLKKLRSFLRYVKKHKHCCSAMQFHDDLKERYALTFNNSKLIQDIHTMPQVYGLSDTCKNKYKTYFNQVLADLAIINKFEDYLHGDYSTLKAHNYVFKIELIRVRNAIYHNNRYKYETSFF